VKNESDEKKLCVLMVVLVNICPITVLDDWFTVRDIFTKHLWRNTVSVWLTELCLSHHLVKYKLMLCCKSNWLSLNLRIHRESCGESQVVKRCPHAKRWVLPQTEGRDATQFAV